MDEVNFPIARQFGDGSSFEVDRTLPLFCIYDYVSGAGTPHDGLSSLARVVPNHAVVAGHAGIARIRSPLTRLVDDAVCEFGACTLIELRWAPTADPTHAQPVEATAPRHSDAECAPVLVVRVRTAPDAVNPANASVRALVRHLHDDRVGGLAVRIECGPPLAAATLAEFAAKGGTLLTLEFSAATTAKTLLRGLVLQSFGVCLHNALNEVAHESVSASHRGPVPVAAALGRQHVSPNVAQIEGALAHVAGSFDLLLQLTPVNGRGAFEAFVKSGCEKLPELVYRPTVLDPDALKRSIYALRIEEVSDPVLSRLLREQREHVDSQLSMIAHRNSSRCLYDSLHLYGGVEDKLYRLARGIAEALPEEVEAEAHASIDAEAFAALARLEFDHYRAALPSFDATLEIRADVTSLMVSENKLLVPPNTRLTEARARALLAHEVGTHLLTFYNGKCQPLALMSTGLAGNEQLQEGLAVLSEYLAGGLTMHRLKLLAARVIAVHHLLSGGDFVEVFRELRQVLNLPEREAFFVTLRVFRAGGFTKDAIYLRGLVEVLDHLRREQPFELLLVGKFATSQLSLMRELQLRRLLKRPALLPRVLETDDGQKRLAALIGQPRTVFDLCHRYAA